MRKGLGIFQRLFFVRPAWECLPPPRSMYPAPDTPKSYATEFRRVSTNPLRNLRHKCFCVHVSTEKL